MTQRLTSDSAAAVVERQVPLALDAAWPARERQRGSQLLFVAVVGILLIGPMLDAWYSQVRFDDLRIGPLSPLQLARGIILVVLAALLLPALRHAARALPVFWPAVLLTVTIVSIAAFHGDLVGNLVYGAQILFVLGILMAGYWLSVTGELTAQRIQRLTMYLLGCIVAIQVYYYLQGSRFYNDYALVGAGDRPSVTAAALTALGPALMLHLRRLNLTAAGLLTGTSLALLATFRRSGIIAFAAGLAVAIAWELLRGRREGASHVVRVAAASLLVLAACASIVFSATLGPAFEERFADLSLAEDAAGSGRLWIWNAAWAASLERSDWAILVGEGMGEVPNAIGRKFGRPISAHNMWLEGLIGLGVVGVLLLAWFHAALLVTALRTHPSVRAAALTAFTVVLVGGLPQSGTLGPTWAPAYLVLGFCVGMTARLRRSPPLP